MKQSSRAPEHEEVMITFYEDSECEGIQLLSECFDAEECMVVIDGGSGVTYLFC